jgi:hypothetical protein
MGSPFKAARHSHVVRHSSQALASLGLDSPDTQPISFLDEYSRFASEPSEDSAFALTSLIRADSSGALAALIRGRGILPNLSSICQAQLRGATAFVRLLIALLESFPEVSTEGVAFSLFDVFSKIDIPSPDREFLKAVLQAIALVIKESTVHHITPTFTKALRLLMMIEFELYVCVVEIFAQCARFIPISVANRHFAVLAREVISNPSTASAPAVARAFVNFVARNPRLIDDPWVVDRLLQILRHCEPASMALLFDFLQSLNDRTVAIVGHEHVVPLVRVAIEQHGGNAECAALRAVRRYLEVYPQECARVYCSSKPSGLCWTLLSKILTLPFDGKVEAGLLIATIFRTVETHSVYLNALRPETICREHAQLIEEALLAMLGLEHNGLLVATLQAMTFILSCVNDELAVLVDEFRQAQIVDAIGGLIDHEDDQIAFLAEGLKKTFDTVEV